MSEENSEKTFAEQAPEAVVQTKRSFSIIWVVPIIALLIGGWLTFKAMTEKGPEITISFETAEGLEAGKTKIKFKDVEVGKVTEITLNEDRSGVVITAEMSKESKPYLTDKTQFWVVRATVAAGKVSGLGTLLSGAYIGINPSNEGEKTRQFKGLEKPPLVTEGMPGRHFVLQSKELGSLDRGYPVYYRGIKVGQVVDYDFDHDRDGVDIKLFIESPFHKKVLENTRFWNASGVDLKMDATGIKLDTQSLVSIMLGGIAFDLPKYLEPGEEAEQDRVFSLFKDRASIEEKTYTIKQHYMLYFDQNVRGLSPGAPVELKGLRIGEVVDVNLEVNTETHAVRIPVLIMVEPERVDVLVTDEGVVTDREEIQDEIEGESITKRKYDLAMQIEKGMRAQLKTGNLLTGQLYVDIDFYPDAPKAKVEFAGAYPVLPTLPKPFEQITESVARILKNVEKIPFEKIGKDLQVAIETLTGTLNEIKAMSGKVNKETVPKINASLDKLEETLDGIKSTLGPDSSLNYNARQVTNELVLAIRSIRSLLEYLERDPQALILGKEGDKK
jgi:paraquat-inducible protein B